MKMRFVTVLLISLLLITLPASAQIKKIKTLQFDCLLCELFKDWIGYPNLAVWVSSDLEITSNYTALNFDALISVVTTIGAPSLFLGYFNAYSQWNFNPKWDDMGRSKAARIQASASAFGLGLLFDNIYEFVDGDGDSKYTPHSADTLVSTYSLIAQKWDKMTFIYTPVSSDVTLYTFTATTQDKRFTIKYHIASGPYQFPSTSAVVTPNVTKIDILIQNYPFVRSDSRLALGAYMAAAQTNAIMNMDISGAALSIGNLGHIEWVSKATVNISSSASASSSAAASLASSSSWSPALPSSELVPLSSSSSSSSSSLVPSSSSLASIRSSSVFVTYEGRASASDISSSMFIAVLSAHSAYQLTHAIFSFDAVHPSSIFWDPSVGFGNSETTSVWLLVLLVLLGVALVSCVGWCGYKMYKKAKEERDAGLRFSELAI